MKFWTPGERYMPTGPLVFIQMEILTLYIAIGLYNHIIEPACRYSITEEDVKIRFSGILKVDVFQDPYLNEITCVDPFR